MANKIKSKINKLINKSTSNKNISALQKWWIKLKDILRMGKYLHTIHHKKDIYSKYKKYKTQEQNIA